MLLGLRQFRVGGMLVVVTDLRDKEVPEGSSVGVILKGFRQ